MTDATVWPMWRESEDVPVVVGYMCLVDFECEIGCAMGGNVVYPSKENCAENRRCTDSCGIVEVEVRARRVVQEPKDEIQAGEKT